MENIPRSHTVKNKKKRLKKLDITLYQKNMIGLII